MARKRGWPGKRSVLLLGIHITLVEETRLGCADPAGGSSGWWTTAEFRLMARRRLQPAFAGLKHFLIGVHAAVNVELSVCADFACLE